MESEIALYALMGLQALAVGGATFAILHRDKARKTETTAVEMQAPVRRVAHAPLCKSVTFHIDGERKVYHPDPRCPEFNSKRSRDQLMKEFRGSKYSMNTHRIGQ